MMDHLVPYTGDSMAVGGLADTEWVNYQSDDDDAEHSIPTDLSHLIADDCTTDTDG